MIMGEMAPHGADAQALRRVECGRPTAIPLTELQWIAGFLEGEGSFGYASHTAYVSAAQIQEWPLIRLHFWFGGSIIQRRTTNVRMWRVHGQIGAGLMMTLWSMMSPRRRGQIERGLASWRAAPTYTKFRSACPRGHRYDMTSTYKTGPKAGMNVRRCRTCRKRQRRTS